MAGNGEDVVFLRTRQLILRGDHLDVVSDAGLKSILREFEFALGEILPFVSDGHLVRRGLEVQQGLADIFVDSMAQVGDLSVDALQTADQFLGFAAAIAIEEREIDLALDDAGPLHATDAAAETTIVSVDAEPRG